MKVTTKADAIRVVIEMSEEEALGLARFLDAANRGLYGPVIGPNYEGWSRDINNAISQARAGSLSKVDR